MDQEKHYLTKEGQDKLKRELETLRFQKSNLLAGSGPKSFRFGEIEAEYIDFQEELGRLDSKILELENVLENHELIKVPSKEDQDKIDLGAKVTVEVDDQIDEFLIVGTLEADPAEGKISNESPVGKALLGHKVGERVIINSPIQVTYQIKNIKY